MQQPATPDTSKDCPACGQRSSSTVDSIFVEYGEWDGASYAFEGDVDVYRCGDVACAFSFADVNGIPEAIATPGEDA